MNPIIVDMIARDQLQRIKVVHRDRQVMDQGQGENRLGPIKMNDGESLITGLRRTFSSLRRKRSTTSVIPDSEYRSEA